MDKIIKCRNPKQSDCCGRIIEKGEMYNKFTLRIPKFNSDNIQIGVEYFKMQICIDCYNKQQNQIEKCNNGEHEVSNIVGSLHGGQEPIFGELHCIHCGAVVS